MNDLLRFIVLIVVLAGLGFQASTATMRSLAVSQSAPGTTSGGEASAQGGPMDGTEASLVKWAITQGGLVVALLLIVWFWRRDLQRIAAKDAEKLEVMTDLVGETKGAIVASTGQSLATEKSLHRLSHALEEMNVRGRRFDSPEDRRTERGDRRT